MNILFLILARGGSKGVPKKNISEICGIPLLGYKAIAAKKSQYCSKIIISTDSIEIAEVAKKFGVEVPFIRPDYLATDKSSSIDSIIHAMEWIEKNDSKIYDAVFLLEPSSPFLTAEDVNMSVEMFIKKKALGVLGVKEVDVSSRFIAEIGKDLNMEEHYMKIKGMKSLRRQDLKKEYTMNGALYIADWNYMKEYRSFHSERTYAYIMPKERSIEIDDMNDLYYAKFLIESNIIDRKSWL